VKNLVGLFLLYYFVLAGFCRSKNQVNKYFHTIFSPGEVSACCDYNNVQHSLQMEAPGGASPFQNF
jgi:hypothetical protein